MRRRFVASIWNRAGTVLRAVQPSKTKDESDKKAVETKNSKHKDFAACLMQSGKNWATCHKELRSADDDVSDAFSASKGSKAALGAKLQTCVSGRTFLACRGEAQKAFEKLRNRTVSKSEFAGELKKAGASKALDKIKDCVSKASTFAAKIQCRTSSQAKEQWALVTGRPAKDIKDEDIEKEVRDSAADDMAGQMRECMNSSTTLEEKSDVS
jgi:hypothetical protein